MSYKSKNVRWNLHGMRNTLKHNMSARQWEAEHRKHAKEMGEDDLWVTKPRRRATEVYDDELGAWVKV